MYIQQECLFSFEEILKFQPKSKLEMILSELTNRFIKLYSINCWNYCYKYCKKQQIICSLKIKKLDTENRYFYVPSFDIDFFEKL
jgi:hypothetical protein